MAHWTEKYIGQPYKLGESDCAALAAKVRREVFQLPVPSPADVERAASRLTRAAQLSDGVEAFGELTDTPVDGDVVLMLCLNRPSHVGVFCVIDGQPCVLHAMENAGMVVLHRLRDLPKFMLAVEGVYKWKTI